MRKIFTAAVAALTVAGALASATTPAQAERYGYHHDDNDEAAAAIAGGVIGLALGAALAGGSHNNGYYYGRGYQPYYGGGYGGGYYGDGYYQPGYAYGPAYRYAPRAYAYGPRMCTSRERVYDPYIGRRVVIERRYRC